MTYDSSDPATIERELAETRARLDARLGELTNRLSPGRLVDDGLDYLRHGQGAEFFRNLGADLRDNPLAVAVTGVGLAWLIAASALAWNRNARPRRMPSSTGAEAFGFEDDLAARAQQAGDTLTRLADESEEAFNTRIAEARAQILGVQREVSETASAFIARVQEQLETARQSVRDRLDRMRQSTAEWGAAVGEQTRRTGEAMGQAAQQGREMMSRAGSAIGDAVNQNPMLLGALGLTAGVLLAALTPASEQEETLMAPLAGALRRSAGEALERGKRAAEAAADTAYREIAER